MSEVASGLREQPASSSSAGVTQAPADAALSLTELRRALEAERATVQEQALIPKLMQHDMANIVSRISLSFSAMAIARDEAERSRWVREVEGGLTMAGQMLESMQTAFLSGATVPDLETTDFAAFVRGVVEQPAVGEATPRLETETPAALYARFSPTLMRYALVALVRNAVAYAGNTWVRVRLTQVRGARWQLTVANGGPGIPRNHRKYILSPCSIAKMGPQQQSDALGLYVARLCLRRHGLLLRVRSNAQATVFAFSIEAVPGA